MKTALFAVAVFLPYMMARLFFKTYKQIWIFLATILCLATGIVVILLVLSFSPTYVGGSM